MGIFRPICLYFIEGRDLTTDEGIQNTLTYEVENRQGYISQFWRYHFGQNLEAFNLPYAREIIFYLTKYPDSEVYIEKFMKDLALPLSAEEINETLRQLVWCDLIRRESSGFYGGLSDPMLGRVLQVEYGWEIAQLMRNKAVEKIKAELVVETRDAKDQMIRKLKGQLSYWLGRFAEMFLDKMMKSHFRDQIVDGTRYFNQPGEIQLSRFQSVFTTMAQPPAATSSYQVDLYGVPYREEALPWVVVVKNWQEPVGLPEVEHFWKSSQNLASDRDHKAVCSWFYSRSGFSGPAREFLDEHSILYTDQVQLEQLLQDLQVIENWGSDHPEE